MSHLHDYNLPVTNIFDAKRLLFENKVTDFTIATSK